MTPWLRRRARADRVLALLGLLVLAPVLAGLALLVLAVDRQAPAVGLARIGRAGRPFTLWKVRTMRTGAGPGADADFTIQDDPRVTRLGHRLRRYRLDELPQLWNVVRGEMALLGPRPEAPGYVDLDDAGWSTALTTPPGIAGPTQVVIHAWEARVDTAATYRSEVLPHKLAIDGWYVANASPAVDLDILRSLFRSVTAPDRPTAVHRRLRTTLPATMAAIDAASAQDRRG